MTQYFVYAEHTAATPANSGVQRVVRGLSRGLQEGGAERAVRFVGWSSEYRALRLLSEDEMKHLSQFDGPSATGHQTDILPLHLSEITKAGLQNAWLLIPEVTTLTTTERQETHGIIQYARRMGMRVAVIVYDLIPLKLEQYAGGAAEHSNYLQYLFDAHCLIPISEFVGADLDHFQSNVEPSVASHRPINRPIGLPYQIGAQPRMALPDPGDDGIILALGTVEPRKNQDGLVRAFITFKDAHPENKTKLIIVGNVHSHMGPVMAELTSGRSDIELRNYVPDAELEVLYQQAMFTVFASVEEGFGLPIAESVWKGVPCISANFGSMAEIYPQGQSTKVNVRDGAELSAKIAELALDKDLRIAIRNEIATHDLPTWADYTDAVCDCLDNAPGVPRVFAYVDSTVEYHGNTGVQRVARRMSAALEHMGVAVDYLCWDREGTDFAAVTEAQLEHLGKWNGPTGIHQMGFLPDNCEGHWLIVPELVLPDPNGAMIINAAKAKGMKVAFIFFDLIPVTLTDIYTPETQAGFHVYFEMLSKADMLIPLTHSGGDELWQYYTRRLPRLNTLKERIQPIPLPGEFGAQLRATNATPRNKANTDLWILAVGTVEPRKNHLAVIHGFRRAQALLAAAESPVTLHLTIAGSTRDHGAYADGVKAEISRTENARLVEAPSDVELGELYQNHDATVFVSLLEGFGIPVLESLWYGKPCIASDNGALGEVAQSGGCIRVPPRDGDALGDALAHLAQDPELYNELSAQAIKRKIPNWQEYALELTWKLNARNSLRKKPVSTQLPVFATPPVLTEPDAPLLSIVVSTYNRAEWLRQSLPLILQSAKRRAEQVEVLVVDNTSPDHTGEIAAQYTDLPFFSYHRNDKNVGMLGNLSVCARKARGKFVWVIGDDDLVQDGVVPRVIDIITQHPRSEIIYLNYSYTRFDQPEELASIDEVIASATLISPITISHFSEEIRSFSALNENLYTAIYACIFRRDHAIAAYTQDTSGAPFSSMLTCIPTSDYVLRNMYDRPGFWIGDSYLVVNMNVSWLRWALIWHLERMPDLFDLAESVGVRADQLEQYRQNHCADPVTWARHIYFGQDPELLPMFSMERFYERCKHIPQFQERIQSLQQLYTEAYLHGRVDAGAKTPRQLAEAFGLFEALAKEG